MYSTLAVRVAVFQLQAQAIISSGQSIRFFASSCFGFNGILHILNITNTKLLKNLLFQSKLIFLVKRYLIFKYFYV